MNLFLSTLASALSSDSSRLACLAALATTLGLPSLSPADVMFTSLGDLPGGADSSEAWGVSNNNVAAGRSSSGNGSEAFRWASVGGMVGLGDLPGPGFFSFAYGISADGGTVVGFGDGFTGGSQQAFRWTAEGGMIGLGYLPGAGADRSSIARGASNTGVVVGYSKSANTAAFTFEAFRWTPAGGMVGLGDLPGDIFNSQAYACTPDGSVIVGFGTGTTLPLKREAMRWTAATGMMGLGGLPGAGRSEAYGVSDDGLVVVGQSSSASGPQAFRWGAGPGMVGLGDLPGGAFNSLARDTNGDGSVVVGRARDATGDVAFIWTAETGIRNLKDELLAQGYILVNMWTLREATGISADGKTIVGWGIDPAGKTRGWMVLNYGDGVDLSPPGDMNGDALVNAADLGLLLAQWGACNVASCPGDLNEDGQVDAEDVGVLLANWSM